MNTYEAKDLARLEARIDGLYISSSSAACSSLSLTSMSSSSSTSFLAGVRRFRGVAAALRGVAEALEAPEAGSAAVTMPVVSRFLRSFWTC